MNTIINTDFSFPGLKSRYVGKVRDVYGVDDLVVMVATDRISAFDCVLPEGISYKGQIFNKVAANFLDATADILPNWKLSVPDPAVTVGYRCEPFKVEMVIRGCLAGHAWREYKEGRRSLCGVPLPEGMKENQMFAEPIITPTTKNLTVHEISNGYRIRRSAVDLNIPLLTNARLAAAFIQCFCTITPEDLAIKSWSEYR